MKKYLISATFHMGDFIWATSAIAILKKTFPDVEITALVPTTLAQLAVNNPVIDKVIYIPYSNNDFKSKIKKLFSSIFLTAKIFFKKFDTAIILDSSRVSILISKLARIPNIIGGDLHSFGYDFKNPTSKYYTHIVKLQKNQDFLHASMRFQTIIKSYFNIYNIYKPILPNSSQYKTKILNLIRNKNKTIVALCIKGSKNTSHILNINKFREVVNLLNNKFSNIDFYIVGTNEDFDYAQNICDIKNVYNICGKTSLLELIEFFKISKLLISLDTGNIHLAATTGINIVSLHGATMPQNTGPMTHKSQVIYHKTDCSPCFYNRYVSNIPCPTYPNPKCLSSITAQEIVQKAISILENNTNE